MKSTDKEKISIKRIEIVLCCLICLFFSSSASAGDFDNVVGDTTISTNTTVSGEKAIRQGSLTINSGVVLEILPDSSLQFEPNYQININTGAQIFLFTGSSILKGAVQCNCVSGDCCDTVTCAFRPDTYNPGGLCKKCTGSSATSVYQTSSEDLWGQCTNSTTYPCMSDYCRGGTTACGYISAGIVCRAAVHSDCDIAETCSGSSFYCPSDSFKNELGGCGGASWVCSTSYTCMSYIRPICVSGACRSDYSHYDPVCNCTTLNTYRIDDNCPNKCASTYVSGSTCFWSPYCNGGECAYYYSNSSKPATYYPSGNTCYYNCSVICTTSGWSRTGCSSAAIDDGNPCTIDSCTASGVSRTNVTNNTQVTGCNNTCQACQNGSCGYAASGTTCPDDGYWCTDDYCDAWGACSHPVKSGTCKIAGVCYSNGQQNPSNSCEVCNNTGGNSQWYWSYTTYGTVCADDGYGCTSDICDGAGTCTHPVKSSWCKIAGVCYGQWTHNPSNYCQWCDYNVSPWNWSNLEDSGYYNISCGTCKICQYGSCSNVPNGTACTGGTCQNGVCCQCTSGNCCDGCNFRPSNYNPPGTCNKCTGSSATSEYQSFGEDKFEECSVQITCDSSLCKMNEFPGYCSGSASCYSTSINCPGYTACQAGVGCTSSARCGTWDYCHSSEDAYWNNFVCGPNTGVCNYVTDKVNCPACQHCPGGTYGSCRAYTDNTQDTTTPNYCNGVCQACQGGYCSYALSGTDPGDRCTTDGGVSCSSGCQRVVTTGLCGSYGVCATTTKYCDYGTSCWQNSGNCYNWTYCNNTDVCWLDTYYSDRVCNSSGTCNIVVNPIGCCQGSKCASGQYCEQSTHQCTALPDLCKVRNDGGFGYSTAPNGTACQNGGTCQNGCCTCAHTERYCCYVPGGQVLDYLQSSCNGCDWGTWDRGCYCSDNNCRGVMSCIWQYTPVCFCVFQNYPNPF